MARWWIGTIAIALVACGGPQPPPAPAPEPAAAAPPDVAPAPAPAPPPVRPDRALHAEGPSAGPSAEGACARYIEVAMSCMEQLAAAGKFPAAQLDQIRASFEQALQARVDASPEQRDAMDQACERALEQQQQAWSQSGCTP